MQKPQLEQEMKTPIKKLEQVRRWRANNIERAREISRKSRLKHRDKCNARAKAWITNNRERHLKYWSDRRKNNPRAILTAKLKAMFGITLEQYESYAINQKHCCAICGTAQSEQRRKMAVDHCHATGKVRGLLCHNCNVGLGNFKDSPQILTKAISYIYEHASD